MKRHLLMVMSVLFASLMAYADDYQLVTKAADINDTDTYILATLYNNQIYAINGGLTTDTGTATSVMKNVSALPETLTIDNSSIKQFQFLPNEDDKFLYCVTDKLYIGAGTKTAIYNSKTAETSVNYKLSITDGSSGYLIIATKGSTNRNLFFQNGTSFKNYATSNYSTSGYTKVAVYKLIGTDNRIPVTLSIEGAPATLNIGESATLTCQSTPSVSGITFISSKPEVATVSSAGVVTAVAAGETTITATFAGDDAYQPKSATVKIRVTDPNAGESFQITFKTGSNTSAALSSKTPKADYILSGAEYISGVKSASTTYGSALGGLRLASGNYAGNVTFTLAESYRISKIVVSAKRYTSTETGVTLKVNGSAAQTITSGEFSDYEFTFDATTETNEIKFESAAKKRLYIQGITIYYATGEVLPLVEAPTFSVAAGSVAKGTRVELSSATEGAQIYYTLDGSAPTTSSTSYSGAIEINATTTVKAIAVKDGMTNSGVSTAVYEVIPEYATLADFIAAKPTSNVIINTPLTVYHYSSPYLYVTDGTANIYAYKVENGTFANGDVIPAGVVGKFNARYNQIDIDATSIGEVTHGTPVEPTEVSTVTKDMLHDYVLIKNVKITGSNATIGEVTVPLYNRFNITMLEGEGMTIVGIVNVNNSSSQTGTQGTLQVYPIEIREPEPTKVADLVVTPTFGNIYQGSDIVITSATEGALLSGTVGEVTLEGVTMPYRYTVSDEIDTQINVNVYAHKEGLENSATLEGTFTVVDRPTVVPGIEATYNWADPSSLTSSIPFSIPTESGNGADLNISDSNSEGTTFTSGNLVMKFGGSPTTKPRIWLKGSDYELRLYKSTEITFYMKSDNGTIDEIEFVYSSNNETNAKIKLVDGQPGSFDLKNEKWTAATVATQAADETSTGVKEVKFYVPSSGDNVFLSATKAKVTDRPTGISVVETQPVDAPAVYYNLQGIRVAHPAEGNIYIRVRGNQVDKIRF